MHDTECCAVQWAVLVAFCERRNSWRAVAYEAPWFDTLSLIRLVEGDLEGTDAEVGAGTIFDDGALAVVADGETAGQASMLACALFEHERATMTFDAIAKRVLGEDRWHSRPAPRYSDRES